MTSYTWSAGSGDYNTVGNWTPKTAVPGANDAAVIAVAAAVTDSQALDLGSGTGSGSLTLDGSGVSLTAAGNIEDGYGGTGLITLEAGATLSFASSVLVGNLSGGKGTLDIDAGSEVSAPVQSPTDAFVFTIANAAASTGLVNVSGAGAELNLNGNYLVVGDQGTATLNITAGGTVLAGTASSTADGALDIAPRDGSTATILVDGSGSTLTATGFGFLGRGGTASLTVSDNAVVTVGDAADRFDIGGGGTSASGTIVSVGGSGALTVESGGVFKAVESIVVGNNGDTGMVTVSGGGVIEAGGQIGISGGGSTYGAGQGTVMVGAGGTLEAGLTPSEVPSGDAAIYLGNYAGGTGTLDVSGAGAMVNANGYRITVGDYGTGVLNVSDGATVLAGSTGSTYPAIYVGNYAGSTGRVTISGAGTTLTADGQVIVGNSGSGSVMVESGAALTTGAGPSSGLILGDAAGSTGSLTVTGAGSTLGNTGALDVGMGAAGSLTIADGGSVSTMTATVGTASVDSTLTLATGTLNTSGTLTVAADGIIDGTGKLNGPDVVDDGVIGAEDGALTVTGAVDGTGGLTIGSGGTLALDGAVDMASGDTVGVAFSGSPNETLDLFAPQSFAAQITGYAAGDMIGVSGVSGGPSYTAGFDSTILTFSNGTTLDLSGAYTPGSVTVVDNPSAPCYCPGTLILTVLGEREVQDLAIGDPVITLHGAAKPVRWIGRRRYAGRFLAGRAHLLPVRIRAGALGAGLPRRDLRVSPQHAMYLDGLLIPAIQLVDGAGIVQERDCGEVEYIHIELERHDVIWAEGAASETFLDDGSRGMFQNADDAASRYATACAAGEYCAPRVESGYGVERVRHRLRGGAAFEIAA